MSKKKKGQPDSIHTGGGAYISGKVDTGGGDFVGRDQNTQAEKGGVITRGNVSGSTIIAGGADAAGSRAESIQTIYTSIDQRLDTSRYEKDDLKEKVQDIEKEDAKGEQADASFIEHRLRNLQRMAPDILEVVLATIANPLAGFGMVAKKVAEKIKAEAGQAPGAPR
jgi:hypothetical protein